jgi:hypothetical protein
MNSSSLAQHSASDVCRMQIFTRPVQISFEFFPPKDVKSHGADPVGVDPTTGAIAATLSSR